MSGNYYNGLNSGPGSNRRDRRVIPWCLFLFLIWLFIRIASFLLIRFSLLFIFFLIFYT
jgi:hypothetical protein